MNSLIKVSRSIFNLDWTISKLSINNILDGYCVEDEIRDEKVKGETAIPYGTYELGYRQSPKFSASFLWSDSLNLLIDPKEKVKYPNTIDWRNHDLIWIKNVPKFEFILIHWGNTDDDTEGCLIVGSSIGPILKNGTTQEGVLNSKVYYKKLYEKVYPLIKKGGRTIVYEKEQLIA